jgi:ribokinase
MLRLMGTVVVVGSVNADVVVRVAQLPGPGETVAGGELHEGLGGKGANEAVAACLAGGAAVRLAGAVGDDARGHEALAALRAAGVDTVGVDVLADVPTGLAAIVVDAGAENQIAVASGANARVDAARVAASAAWQGPVDTVLTCLELGDDAVLAAARRARELGVPFVLDPAPARALPPELLALGPLLKPNAGEARALTGEDDPRRAAAALARRTGAPALVTLGPQGALLADGDDVTALPALPVDAVDATGAGDAAAGVLAAGLAAGLDVEAAARRALVAASLATRAPGAQGGLPSAEELDAAL